MKHVVGPADPFGTAHFFERFDEPAAFGDVWIEDLSGRPDQSRPFFGREAGQEAAIAAKFLEQFGQFSEPIGQIGRFSPALRGSSGRHAPDRISTAARERADQLTATARQLKARTMPMSSRAASDM
jgi:hypothetical protein